MESDPCSAQESVESSGNELAELYQELDRQTAHAYKLTSQISQLQEQLRNTQRELENQQSYASLLERERALVKSSRWIKLGRRLSVGPKLD